MWRDAPVHRLSPDDAGRSASTDLRFEGVVYGPIVTHVFPDVQVEAYRYNVQYVSLVSVVDWSVLNWMEQRELRGLASEDRLFGTIAEPGWVLMDLYNSFKDGRREHFECPVQPQTLELTTNDQGYEGRIESPGLE